MIEENEINFIKRLINSTVYAERSDKWKLLELMSPKVDTKLLDSQHKVNVVLYPLTQKDRELAFWIINGIYLPLLMEKIRDYYRASLIDLNPFIWSKYMYNYAYIFCAGLFYYLYPLSKVNTSTILKAFDRIYGQYMDTYYKNKPQGKKMYVASERYDFNLFNIKLSYLPKEIVDYALISTLMPFEITKNMDDIDKYRKILQIYDKKNKDLLNSEISYVKFEINKEALYDRLNEIISRNNPSLDTKFKYFIMTGYFYLKNSNATYLSYYNAIVSALGKTYISNENVSTPMEILTATSREFMTKETDIDFYYKSKPSRKLVNALQTLYGYNPYIGAKLFDYYVKSEEMSAKLNKRRVHLSDKKFFEFTKSLLTKNKYNLLNFIKTITSSKSAKKYNLTKEIIIATIRTLSNMQSTQTWLKTSEDKMLQLLIAIYPPYSNKINPSS